MLVKLPIVLMTLRNWSGRCHATVNAQMAPELAPAIAAVVGVVGDVVVLLQHRQQLVDDQLGVLVVQRVVLDAGGCWSGRPTRRRSPPCCSGPWPGLMNTPIVTGISRR